MVGGAAQLCNDGGRCYKKKCFLIRQLQESSTTSSYVFVRERKKKVKKRKKEKKKSFETCSRIRYSSFSLIFPSSFDLGIVGW
jgi:hypothetical protein